MKKFCTILLVTLLLATFVCTFVACNKKSNKKEIVKHEYYQMKVAKFQQENTLYPDGVDCVFIGDSWTDGYNLEKFYPEITVLNRGIGGDNSYGLLQRLDVSVYGAKPKVVVMLIGGNNMNDCDADIEQIILEIRENLPQTQIVMQSMYTITAPSMQDKRERVLEMCTYFKTLCTFYGLTYVDVYSHLLDENGQPVEAYHVEDGVHMSDEGYQVITDQLKPVILQLLGR